MKITQDQASDELVLGLEAQFGEWAALSIVWFLDMDWEEIEEDILG